MRPVRSIICFNGGSGGDFLKVVCNEQLADSGHYYVRRDGTINLANNNFKEAVEQIYYQQREQLNDVNAEPVENTHYYIEQFTALTPNLFFIDYPDEINPGIVQLFIDKRCDGSQTKFLAALKPSLPESLQNKLNLDNLFQSGCINWQKNIKLWRANKNLQPVQLKDFFDYSTLHSIVKTITGLDNLNDTVLTKTYNAWVGNNNYLKELFTK